jgi:16S rRNA (adenine1518-N6/adenine1519-N6)-dimethyltransferase
MPRPKLGQHFLRDPRVVEKSVAAADLSKSDVVLEIGPGRGVLTRALGAAADRVVAIEIDGNLCGDLREAGLPANVELRNADAVSAPWPSFTACVSNLPYQASSPLLFRMLDEGPSLGMTRAVLLVQKEFADRLLAQPDTPEYGRLSVERMLRADARRVARVAPGAFQPPPRVDSAIVRLDPRAPPFEIADAPLLHAVIRAGFAHRRKTLRRALESAADLLPLNDRNALVGLPHALRRPGELVPAEFEEVARHLAPFVGAGHSVRARRAAAWENAQQ